MFKFICGPGIPAPFSYGSRVILYRTPLCNVVQGSYVSGSVLPDYGMTYSDTGSDTDFGLKLTDYGWGTFFVKNTSDSYCTFEVKKGRKLECGSLSKKFEIKELWETLIPSSTVLSAEEIAKHVAARYVDTDTECNVSYTLYISIEYDANGNPYIHVTSGLLSLNGKTSK